MRQFYKIKKKRTANNNNNNNDILYNHAVMNYSFDFKLN